MLEPMLSFFTANTPPLRTILTAGPLAFLWALGCLALAGHVKFRFGLRTGYSRKIFHFLIFFSVALTQWAWGTPMVCLLGGMTSSVVFLAVILGAGNPLYEAIAREADAPHRTHFILVPYLATLLGGLASNIVFGPVAVVGYLVAGLGDAVGEPVGVRFGRHTYRVPSLADVPSTRSFEGSAAVGLMSLIGILLAVLLSPTLELRMAIVFIALISTLVEAVSPHGWDNCTMQVVPTALAAGMLTS